MADGPTKLRIAMPIHSFEPGGVERVGLRLARYWRDEGHEVIVVLGRDRGATRDTAPDLDYRTRPEPFATDGWETLWMMWCFARFLRRERVDVIFCAGLTYTVVCVVMKLLFGSKCPPVVVKVSNDLARPELPPLARPFYRWWLGVQGRMLDRFVALAEPMLPQIVAELGVSADKVVVIPDPALDEAILARLADTASGRERGKGIRYLSIGRLWPQKNYALLIEAFARCAGPDDTLVIAGEGNERGALENLVGRLDLADRITLPGHVTDPVGLYAEADIFVLSSDYEGVPAVIIEALAAGLPIAATDCCASMDWLIQHGKFGVLSPPRDPEALGRAMIAARDIPATDDEMRRFAGRFMVEKSARLYISLLQQSAL